MSVDIKLKEDFTPIVEETDVLSFFL